MDLRLVVTMVIGSGSELWSWSSGFWHHIVMW